MFMYWSKILVVIAFVLFTISVVVLLIVLIDLSAGPDPIHGTNPFEEHDICFEVDYPGATDRFTTFMPVKCENGESLGSTFGADYAILSFEDLDNDGMKEIKLESSSLHCKLDGCFDALRIVYKVRLSDPPTFTEILREKLPYNSF